MIENCNMSLYPVENFKLYKYVKPIGQFDRFWIKNCEKNISWSVRTISKPMNFGENSPIKSIEIENIMITKLNVAIFS